MCMSDAAVGVFAVPLLQSVPEAARAVGICSLVSGSQKPTAQQRLYAAVPGGPMPQGRGGLPLNVQHVMRL